MTKNTQWHDLRAKNIGGSDIAALFNESPYSSRLQLYHIKKGNMEPDNLDGIEYVEAGNRLEGAILDWANDKYGTTFTRPQIYLQHKTVGGMGCTPDGIDWMNGQMSQVKVVDAMVFGKKWEADGDLITNAPLHIMLQCQHEMACAGPAIRENHLIVLVGGNRLCRMVIERDEEIIATIEAEVKAFWDSVAHDEEPDPDYKQDSKVLQMIRRLKPEVDELDLTGNNHAMDAARRYLDANAQLKELEEQKKAASAEVLHLAGGAKKLKVSDRISVTIVENKGTPDYEITAEMVGQTVKGRAPSVYPLIKEKAA